jgi:hypothetical protein
VEGEGVAVAIAQAPEFSERNLTLLFDLWKRELDDQISLVDSLDTKIGIFLSVASALIALLAAVVVLKAPHFNVFEVLSIIATSVIYFALLVQAWSGLKPREWKAGPSGDGLIAAMEAGENEHLGLLRRSIKTLQEHRDQNDPDLAEKNHALTIMLRWFMAEAVVVYFGILLTAVGL